MARRSYKTVLLGDASVGKSSFAVRLTKGEFSDNTNSTIGAAFFTYTVHCDSMAGQSKLQEGDHSKLLENSQQSQPDSGRRPRGIEANYYRSGIDATSSYAPSGNFVNSSSYEENITIKFDIWDTAGQERFKSIAPIYYRRAACAIVILDISSPPTLQHAAFWVNQIRVANNNETIIVLVANKIDLLGSTPETVQTLANAKAYAKEHSIFFVETSAKTGQNITYVFELLSQEISKDPYRWDKNTAVNQKANSKALNIDPNSSTKTSKTCCKYI